MQRRKFVKYAGTGSALLAGLTPLAIGFDHNDQDISENKVELTGHWYNHNYETEKVICQLKQYNGKPTIHVNGVPCFPMAFISYFPKQFRYKNMRNSGIRFFSLGIRLGDRWLAANRRGKVKPLTKGIWYAQGKIDFETFDNCINEIFEVAPDAYVFPRILCDSPSWWDSYHPAETNRTYKEGFPMQQSFSSLIWRNETAEVLRMIVRHLYQSTYANRFIGIHVTAGETEEATHQAWLGSGDYSLAAQNKFRQWLINRYGSDENLIKKYFNLSIDQISIPSPEERKKAEFGDFLDPQISRLAVDYRYFRAEEIVESLDFLCKAVKEESNGNLLTGTFYGYTLSQWLDHMAFSHALHSPNIDFFTSCEWVTINNSIQKANKIFYYEADIRTYLSKWISEIQPEIDPYHEYIESGWIRPNETIEKTLERLKFEFTKIICTNSINWWFDLWGGWYDHERILNLFSEMQKIGDESIHLPCNSISEVCVFVDEKSFLYHAPVAESRSRKDAIGNLHWFAQQKAQIDKMGAPYDIYLTEDLKDLDLSKYKLLIFLNAFLLNQQERQMISEKCMSDQRFLLWMYAPGLISDRISIENISSFVNMDIGSEKERLESEIIVKLTDQTMTFKGSKVSPFLYVKSGATGVSGNTKDGFAVLAEKKEKNCTNVLVCNPPVPWQVIQYYARKAGVNIYSDAGDTVLANRSYLSITAAKPGKRIIQLPEKKGLLELLNSDNEFKTVDITKSRRIKEFEVDFRETGSVRFYKMI